MMNDSVELSNENPLSLKTSQNFVPKCNINSFQTKSIAKNKKLVRNLNNKIFKGFKQIQNAKRYRPITYSKEFPTLQWEKPALLPFDEMYNLNYKYKHLSSRQGPNLNQLLVVENMKPSLSKTRNNVFLTSDYKKKTFASTQQSPVRDSNKEFLLRQLFPYDNELENISSLKFISMEKKPFFGLAEPKMSKAKQKEDERFREVEFLYKISHPLRDPKTESFFFSKKGLVKGATSTIQKATNPTFQKETSDPNDKNYLKLDIIGSNTARNKLLTLDEKKFNHIHNNLEMIRALPKDTFKDYIDKLFEDIGEEYKEPQPNIKEIQFQPEKKREAMILKIIKRQPQMIKYNVFQGTMNHRGDKYNEIRKMAFELKKIKEKESSNNKCKINTISPNSHLLTDNRYTYTDYYNKQAKKRDTKMAWGLRKELDPDDIKKMLNGKDLPDMKMVDYSQ